MQDHEFAHYFLRGSAILGLAVASMFAFVLITADSVALESSLGATPGIQAAAVALTQIVMQPRQMMQGGQASSSQPNHPMPAGMGSMGSSTMASSSMAMGQNRAPMRCPVLGGTLALGSRDATSTGQVHQLQQFLASYYGIASSSIVTGYFGSTTQSLVRKFQSQQGLSSVGSAGPLTRQAIVQACGGMGSSTPMQNRPNMPAPPPRMGSSTPTNTSQ